MSNRPAAGILVTALLTACASDTRPPVQPVSDTIPPARIENLAATSLNDSSIYVNWISPGDDDDRGTAALYELRYAASPMTEENLEIGTLIPLNFTPRPAGTPQGVIVDSLLGETTYYFALRTADEIPNWSPVSNIVNAKTGWDSIPPATITTLRVARAHRNHVVLTWRAPAENYTPSRAESYEIRYDTDWISPETWPSAIPVAAPPLPLAPGMIDSLLIPGLEPGTLYYFAIRSRDVRGNYSNLSDVAYVRTVGVSPRHRTNLYRATTRLRVLTTSPAFIR